MTSDVPPDTLADNAESPPQEPTADNIVEFPEGDVAEPSANDWEAKYQTLNGQLLRLAADFDNHRKRSFNEQQQAKRQAVFQTVSGLLPVLDNLDRARQSLNASSDPKVLYQSFEMLANQLTEALVGLGIERIETVGQAFDPALHEALSQAPNHDHAEGIICQEYQAGFQLQGQVLKPARVVVSSGAGDASEANTAEASDVKNVKITANPFAKSSSTNTES